jgi:PPK2 family polyphosphate:nucleotide phosphotransferase
MSQSLSKEEAHAETEKHLERMRKLLYQMYAENKHSLLIILQGIDASGKDGVVDHIFRGANPQGLRVYSFKEPTPEELRHDFLWRCHKVAPESGLTAIFNRSYYEEVTTVRVHKELLLRQHLPDSVRRKKNLFDQRYEQINAFEKMLCENGTVILKFLLQVSKGEQKKRLEERIADPTKKWKFSIQDAKERKFFDSYLKVFNKMVAATHSPHAPWYVIPADKKWYRNYLVSKHIVDALSDLKMKYPGLPRKAPHLT